MFHKLQTAGEIHQIHQWEVVDATARAALVLAATDIGKVARQTGDNTFWLLINNVGPVWFDLTSVTTALAWSAITSKPQNIVDIAALVDPNADKILFWDDSAGAYTLLAPTGYLSITGTNLAALLPVAIPVACSDETTALTVGTAKVTFHSPLAFTLRSVMAGLTTVQTSGSIFTVDMKKAGVSLFTTKPTIDNTEDTTQTAATASVLTTPAGIAIAKGDKITIDISQIGDGTAKGLKLYLIGDM